MSFKFELNAKVTINHSGTKGVVTGRAEYLDRGTMYYIEYANHDGMPKEEWFASRQLSAA